MGAEASPRRDQIALAADVALPEAIDLYRRVSPWVGFAKVGLSLFVEHGPAAVRPFLELGAKVFLDLKLHDIPNTVEHAARNAGRLGVSLLTVHAQGGVAMLKAAARGAREGAAAAGQTPPRILAVTVLTSLSDADLIPLGHAPDARSLAVKLASAVELAGVDGVVCSAQEVGELSRRFPRMYFCTPGVRLADEAAGDQSRVETPGQAIRNGSNLLVVGRPIYASADPEAAAKRIAADLP